MLKFFRLFLLCFLFKGALFAYTHPCSGEWLIEADYLFLLPSVDDTYFVLNASQDGVFPDGTREQNDFDFQSGFRVGGAYGFCDCNRELRGYYTRLRATQSRTVNGDFLWPTVGRPNTIVSFESFPGSASSDLDLLYQRADGFFAQKIFCCCGLDLYLQGGLEFAYIRLHEDIDYNDLEVGETGTRAQIFRKSRAWGIGPQLGLELGYEICQFSCCLPSKLSVVGYASGSLLASQTRDKEFEQNVVNNTGQVVPRGNTVDEHTWRIIPALHAQIGLNYEMCFSCFGASLEVGYEFNSYLRALSRLDFPAFAEAISLTYTHFVNFDVQGLYVAGTITF